MDSGSVWKGIAYGSFCSMVADIITLPVDVTKTRMQLSGSDGKKAYKNSLDCVSKTIKAEGVGALWKGLEPALWRQATYGGMRYGLYSPCKDLVAPGLEKHEMGLHHKILAGGMSGAIGSAICNPCDLVKVRMMAAGSSAGSHSYNWFIPAFIDIVKNEGFFGLYKGVGPTVARATALAAAELASYDQIRETLVTRNIMEEGVPLHFATATAAGFIGSFACNPFDVAKSRVMNQPVDAAGKGKDYSGMIDCMAKAVRNEGVASLWKGFIPAWCRVGPRVIIIFMMMEQLKATFG